MQRVSVVGAPGSGKTTLGRTLASRLDVPFIELDAIFHQPDWTDLPRDDFRARVDDALAGDGWIVDGNYPAVQDLVWQAADTVVWLDLPRGVVVRRVARRTLRRAVTRERLWNGNVEPLTNFYRLSPEKNIIRWTWVKHAEYAEHYADASSDPANKHLRFVRLVTQEQIDAFLGRCTRLQLEQDRAVRNHVSTGSPFEISIGFSRAVRVGRHVVVSGTAPVWPDGSCDPDPEAQARRCFEIIGEALAELDARRRHVTRTRMFITDPAHAEAVGRAHRDAFGDVQPAATTVVVAGLLDPGWHVEIEAEAYVDD